MIFWPQSDGQSGPQHSEQTSNVTGLMHQMHAKLQVLNQGPQSRSAHCLLLEAPGRMAGDVMLLLL